MAEPLKTHACTDVCFTACNTGVLGVSPRLASPTQNKRIPDADNHTWSRPGCGAVAMSLRSWLVRNRCYLSCSHPYNVGS
jgi:hypothetical protein